MYQKQRETDRERETEYQRERGTDRERERQSTRQRERDRQREREMEKFKHSNAILFLERERSMAYVVPLFATRRGGKDDKSRRDPSLHGWEREIERGTNRGVRDR